MCVYRFVYVINARTALRIEIWSRWYTCVLRWFRHIWYVFLGTCQSARAHGFRGLHLISPWDYVVFGWCRKLIHALIGPCSEIQPDYHKGSRHSAIRNGCRFFWAVVFSPGNFWLFSRDWNRICCVGTVSARSAFTLWVYRVNGKIS